MSIATGETPGEAELPGTGAQAELGYQRMRNDDALGPKLRLGTDSRKLCFPMRASGALLVCTSSGYAEGGGLTEVDRDW